MCDICVLFCELEHEARMHLTGCIQCLLAAYNWPFFETNHKLNQQIHVKYCLAAFRYNPTERIRFANGGQRWATCRDKHNLRLIIILFVFRIWLCINFNENRYRYVLYVYLCRNMLKSAGYRLQQPQSCHLALDNNFVSINYNYPVGAWQLCNFVNLPSNSIHTHTHTHMHAHTGSRWLVPSMFSCPRRQCRHTHIHICIHVCVSAGDMVAGWKRYLNRPLEHVLPEMQQKAAIFARSQLSKGICCSGCSLNWNRNKGSNSFNLINTVGPHGEWVTHFQAINRIRLYLLTRTRTNRGTLWNPADPTVRTTNKRWQQKICMYVWVCVCATKPEANG